MLGKFRILLVGLLSFAVLLAPAAVQADCSKPATPQEAIQCGTSGANGGATQSTSQAATNLNSVISTVLNILSVAVGIAAVLMIIMAGFRFITSGGNAEKVKSAKNALAYALVGIAVVALAQIIVKFVLNKTTQ